MYRPELPPLPPRIAALPVHRGYPVPWFVAWLDDNGEEGDLPDEAAEPAGIMLKRNPGVALVWVTRKFRIRSTGLFDIGDPCDVAWYAEGRPATRAEVEASLESGLPFLRELVTSPHQERAFERSLAAARELLP